ncbi:hypothetical protein T11_9056 [Trichinella zimbabwensis]|uniref:Uncharacterized protein n=1 Tax=Trichinella zimbabwensis TaxID=268475 RepID=A0A0V1H046_9BILA|nr:hypothetical protein T11_9056 [Trichinella zimbabwensis]
MGDSKTFDPSIVAGGPEDGFLLSVTRLQSEQATMHKSSWRIAANGQGQWAESKFSEQAGTEVEEVEID